MPHRNVVKLRTYTLVERAVDEGLAHGWRRAHKHVESPTPEAIQEELQHAIMLALDEVLVLSEEEPPKKGRGRKG